MKSRIFWLKLTATAGVLGLAVVSIRAAGAAGDSESSAKTEAAAKAEGSAKSESTKAGGSLSETSESSNSAKSRESSDGTKLAEAGSTLPPIAAIRAKESTSCLSDPAALEDIRLKRDQLEAKARELTARETEFKAKEQALEEGLKRLESVRDEIAKAESFKKKDSEEKVGKLVETIQGMSPKSAAQLLAGIDSQLAVATMSRISTERLSKIMNVMEPEKSSRLSELLVGVGPKSAMNASQHGKGGERDGNSDNDANRTAERGNREPGAEKEKPSQ